MNSDGLDAISGRGARPLQVHVASAAVRPAAFKCILAGHIPNRVGATLLDLALSCFVLSAAMNILSTLRVGATLFDFPFGDLWRGPFAI